MKNIYFGFDLDETLIHSKSIGIDQLIYDDANFNIYNKEGGFAYSVYERMNARLLLNYVNEHFTLFFYTRAGEDYAKQIISNLGFKDSILFFGSSVDKEYVETLNEGKRRYEVKRLDKIAKKMNTSIENIVFIDDIRNSLEIRPITSVLKVPEFNGSELDSVLNKIYLHLKHIKVHTIKEFKESFFNLEENELIQAANPLKKLETINIKNKKIKKEP